MKEGEGQNLGAAESSARARSARERDLEERRARRGDSDVNYGAAEEQVPAEGWVP